MRIFSNRLNFTVSLFNKSSVGTLPSVLLIMLMALCVPSFGQTVPATGIVGNTTVIFNDLEDHGWTYYSAKPDGDYPDVMRSPNPRNVKITYRAGSVDNASAPAVSSTEPQNEFVYYKTIEQKAWGNSEGHWLTGDYAYRVIPNPFSKRPRTNGTTGTSGFYGFAGWKIVSGGKYINGYNNNQVLPLEQKINFVNLDYDASNPNAVTAEVVFEATWTSASVVTFNKDGNINNSDPSGLNTNGTYETNFIVVTDSRTHTVSGLTKGVTVSSRYPDGSAGGGTPTISSFTTNSAPAKLEYIQIGDGITPVHPTTPSVNSSTGAGTGTFTAQAGELIVGRGCTGTVNYVCSGGSGGKYSFRIESGKYIYMYTMSSGSANANNYGRVVLGCDYDRAADDGIEGNGTGDNTKLRIVNYCSLDGVGGAAGNNASELLDITVKSGYYGFSANPSLYTGASAPDGYGLGIGGNTDNYTGLVGDFVTTGPNGESVTYTYTAGDVNNITGNNNRWRKLLSFYVGPTRGAGKGGVNRMLVEGGEFNSINGGGTRPGADNAATDNVMGYYFRMKGGWVKGAVYGTASISNTRGSRCLVFTGGEVNGWVAGGCNGTDFSAGDGINNGTCYIYAGGRTQLRSHDGNGTYNNAYGLVFNIPGGQIFGAGRGLAPVTNSNVKYCGSTTTSYVAVADECQVEQNVYGGGYNGVSNNSHVYILGGTIGKKVFGGTARAVSEDAGWRCNNTDIRMYGGTVLGGIYGGHDETGIQYQNASVKITGGTVGQPGQLGFVFGGGLGSATSVRRNVTVQIGEGCNATSGATIYGDVYGGSAEGFVNGTAANNTYSTNVTLYKGTIYGGLYGGGLGTTTPNHPADVYGPVSVKVFGGSVRTNDGTGENGSGGVFGCNNTNGTPMGSVSVDIYGTDPAEEGHEYALFAVYGGGNRSDYTGTPVVTIHGCSNRIEYVYGGGNASAVRQTDVTIWGGHIGNAFGGGNGFSVDNNHGNPSAAHYNPGANITSGGTHLLIHGGTVKSVFGGSNQYGTINGGINVTVTEQDETGSDDCDHAYTHCPLRITELFGGGNEAPALTSGGDYISPNVQITSCNAIIDNLYGGAKQAFHGAPITLNVTGGHFQNVFGGSKGTPETGADIDGTVTLNLHGGTMVNAFGGNDVKGNITGKITVNVLSNQVTCPLHVDNVYGGGQEAAYSPDDASAISPEVNIQHGTVNNAVFGGGLGSGAIVTANPKVTVGDVANPSYQATVGARLIDDSRDGDGNVYGGGSQAAVSGNTLVVVPKTNTLISNNVFGGGSQAGVSGNTTVNMSAGTVTTALYGGCNTSGTVSNGTSVLMSGGTTTTIYGGGLGAGTTVNKGSASFGTSVTISGSANVTGNVFGGGNAGLVNGSTHVTLQQ